MADASTDTTVVKTPLQYLDKAMSGLRELGLIKNGARDDDPITGLLEKISDLEPEVVKLDRELIAGLTPDTRQFRLLTSIVDPCHRMEAQVIAEWALELSRRCRIHVPDNAKVGVSINRQSARTPNHRNPLPGQRAGKRQLAHPFGQRHDRRQDHRRMAAHEHVYF